MTAPITMMRRRGFTLVEAVIVIAITGIIAAVVAVFIRAPIEGYFDSARRAELTDIADTALRRMGRDVRLALSNSVRIPGGAAQCMEYLPTVGGGRYRAECSTQPCPAGEDPLDFTQADNRFDVLGGLSDAPAVNDYVAIYNLGLDGANAYSGQNRALIAAAGTSSITLATATAFPFASPGNRFQIIPASEQAVFYVCVFSGPNIDAAGNGTGTLFRMSRYGFNPVEPAACPTPAADTPALATNVSACSFAYSAGTTERNGLVSMRLSIRQKNEEVSLYHEVHVSNVP